MIDFYGIKLFDYPSMIEVFMYLILSNGMLDIIVLDLLRPTVVEVVDLASYLSAVLEVIGFIHL